MFSSDGKNTFEYKVETLYYFILFIWFSGLLNFIVFIVFKIQ